MVARLLFLSWVLLFSCFISVFVTLSVCWLLCEVGKNDVVYMSIFIN